jgi:hypothetical protein
LQHNDREFTHFLVNGHRSKVSNLQNQRFLLFRLASQWLGGLEWRVTELKSHGGRDWTAAKAGHAAVRLDWVKIRDFTIAIIIVAGCFVAVPTVVALSVPFGVLSLLVLCVVLLLFLPLRVAVRWLLGYGGKLPAPIRDGEKGIGEALSVLAFILTQLLALAVSQTGRRALRDEPTSFQVATLLTYSLIAFAIFGTLVKMIRLTTVGKDGRPERFYGPGALRFMRWIFVCGSFLVLAFSDLAWCGELPTQVTFKKVPLKVLQAEAWTFKKGNDEIKGVQGIRALIPITKAEFPDGIPKRLFLEFSVGSKISDAKWRVIGGKLFVGEPESDNEPEKLPEFEPYLGLIHKPAKRTFEVGLSELNAHLRYTLVLYLWAPPDERAKITEILQLLNDPKQEALTVVGLLKAD